MGDEDVWAQLKEKLPWEKTDEGKKKREEQWNQIDVNGNGYLSLAEVDKAMKDTIQLPVLFDLKPVVLRAFQAAKDIAPAKSKKDDDYIQKVEYRMLLGYLRQYYEYWLAFSRIDTDSDKRVSFEEFEKAKDKIGAWGIDMSDPAAQWKECDKDGGGMVLFDEFCEWAIRKSLDLDDDDDAE